MIKRGFCGGDEVVLKGIHSILPHSIRSLLEALPKSIIDSLEEIRIRQDRPLEIITTQQSWFVKKTGQLSMDAHGELYRPDREECIHLLNLISQHSLYAFDEELKRGFVTVKGGHRIGLAGRVITENGKVRRFRDFTGFNIRIARQIKGVGEPLIPWIFERGVPHHVLIISPPQCGKTTLIRDLARIASSGTKYFRGYKVGIVDERSEIAGCLQGVPQHDVGPRTDVLDSCPKAEGMMMMIRSLSPDILVVDEIGSQEDSDAVHEAVYAGIRLFCTVHGKKPEELIKRPTLKSLLEERIFTRIIVLSRAKGPGTVEKVLNEHFQPVFSPAISSIKGAVPKC